MKARNLIKRWLTDACIYFTVVSLILIALQFLINGTEGSARIHTLSFLMILPFALSLSAAGMLLCSERLISSVRYLLHFIITMLSLFLFLYLPSDASVKPSTTLILFVLLSLCYWAILGLVFLIRARVHRLMQED